MRKEPSDRIGVLRKGPRKLPGPQVGALCSKSMSAYQEAGPHQPESAGTVIASGLSTGEKCLMFQPPSPSELLMPRQRTLTDPRS